MPVLNLWTIWATSSLVRVCRILRHCCWAWQRGQLRPAAGSLIPVWFHVAEPICSKALRKKPWLASVVLLHTYVYSVHDRNASPHISAMMLHKSLFPYDTHLMYVTHLPLEQTGAANIKPFRRQKLLAAERFHPWKDFTPPVMTFLLCRPRWWNRPWLWSAWFKRCALQACSMLPS